MYCKEWGIKGEYAEIYFNLPKQAENLKIKLELIDGSGNNIIYRGNNLFCENSICSSSIYLLEEDRKTAFISAHPSLQIAQNTDSTKNIYHNYFTNGLEDIPSPDLKYRFIIHLYESDGITEYGSYECLISVQNSDVGESEYVIQTDDETIDKIYVFFTYYVEYTI